MQNNNTAKSSRQIKKSLPWINIVNRQLRDLTKESVEALRAANEPPTLFGRGGEIVLVIEDEKGRNVIAEVGPSVMRGKLARVANYYYPVIDDDGNEVGQRNAYPPLDVVHDVRALSPDELDLPTLHGIVEVPSLRPDGTIIDVPGYDRSTGLSYLPSQGLKLPSIPNQPTKADIDNSLQVITEPIR